MGNDEERKRVKRKKTISAELTRKILRYAQLVLSDYSGVLTPEHEAERDALLAELTKAGFRRNEEILSRAAEVIIEAQ